MLRSFIHFFLSLLVRLLARVEVIDIDNVPYQGGYILATNHVSILDPVLIFVTIQRKDMTALVAKKHQKNPVFRWIVELGGGPLVEPGRSRRPRHPFSPRLLAKRRLVGHFS